jgi:hypothetical protein
MKARLIAVGAIAVGAGLFSAPATASYAYQGSDYSHTFSSNRAAEACDRESDDIDYGASGGTLQHAYDPNGNDDSNVCGTYGPSSSSTIYRHRAVEYDLGPDSTGPWVRGS